MSTDEKKQIRERITAATGTDCGDVHPEFFISDKSAPRWLAVDNSACPCPHLKILLVNPAGEVFDFGNVYLN